MPAVDVSAPSSVRSDPGPLVRFGGVHGVASDLGVEAPWLAGSALEAPLPGARGAGERDGLRLWQAPGALVAIASEPAGERLADPARSLYRRLLQATAGLHLARVWNYVPRINEEVDGLERYRAFCLGRSQAFEDVFGTGFEARLPAASAVGARGEALALIAVATESAVRHVENPEQVPAWAYPREHGPRPPSFARATRATAAGREWVFISGTSSIKGHATIAPGDLAGQLACTLGNLRLISAACGLGPDLGRGGWERRFKVYLRHRSDLAAARAALAGWLDAGDQETWLESDICRAALLVEIEATLSRPLGSA